MLILYKTALKFLGTVLFVSVVSGCISSGPTKPNDPFAGPYPAGFNELANHNPLLVQEIAKLPEIQDGVSDNDAAALERIIKLYDDNTEKFNIAFEQMYHVGKPDVRKYCTPLQSLFWLAEDAKVEELAQIIKNYSLDKLLQNAWIFEIIERELYKEKVLELSETQIKMIADELIAKDPDEKILVQGGLENHTINDLILIHFKENRNHFSRKAKKTIKDSLVDIDQYKKDDKNHFRWKGFDTVVERLNAPDLVNHYINTNITYIFDHYTCQAASHTFSRKKGCCVCLAKFGQYCLERAGYKTFIRHLVGNFDQHGVLVVKSNDQYFIVVDFTASSINQMSGPFKNISEVDSQISFVTGPIIYQRKNWN